MNLADTFINVNPGSPDHLWVVITRPTTQGEIAMVNFATRRPPCDDSCIIAVGEHPFVTSETIILYSRGQMTTDAFLEHAKQHFIIQERSPVSDALLERIQLGALDSTYTKQAIQNAVLETLGMEDAPPTPAF